MSNNSAFNNNMRSEDTHVSSELTAEATTATAAAVWYLRHLWGDKEAHTSKQPWSKGQSSKLGERTANLVRRKLTRLTIFSFLHIYHALCHSPERRLIHFRRVHRPASIRRSISILSVTNLTNQKDLRQEVFAVSFSIPENIYKLLII